MKKFYYIFPVALLAVFSAVYSQFSKASDEAASIRAEKAAALKTEEENKRKVSEAKSREDSEKRVAARQAEEKKKEEERIVKWEAETKRVADEGRQHAAQTTAYTAEIAVMEKELAELRATKDVRNREYLASATDVELTAIAKRSAELEIQRLTEMVARKAAGTSIMK